MDTKCRRYMCDLHEHQSWAERTGMELFTEYKREGAAVWMAGVLREISKPCGECNIARVTRLILPFAKRLTVTSVPCRLLS